MLTLIGRQETEEIFYWIFADFGENFGEENGTNFDENLVENVLEENVTQFGESFCEF